MSSEVETWQNSTALQRIFPTADAFVAAYRWTHGLDECPAVKQQRIKAFVDDRIETARLLRQRFDRSLEHTEKVSHWSRDGDELVLWLVGPVAVEDDRALNQFTIYNALAANTDATSIMLRISSFGGCVAQATGILIAIRETKLPTRAIVDDCALSAATLFTLAADHVAIREHAQLYFHRPSTHTPATGNAKFWRRIASELDLTTRRFAHAFEVHRGIPAKRIRQLINRDTYVNAKQALRLGLVDEIIPDQTTHEDSSNGN